MHSIDALELLGQCCFKVPVTWLLAWDTSRVAANEMLGCHCASAAAVGTTVDWHSFFVRAPTKLLEQSEKCEYRLNS